MKTRKFAALLCGAIMVLALMSGPSTTVGAMDIDGDWTVYRTPSSYIPNEDGSEKVVAPCPGYEYTDEGFSLTDREGNTIENTRGYRCRMTVVDGDVVWKD